MCLVQSLRALQWASQATARVSLLQGHGSRDCVSRKALWPDWSISFFFYIVKLQVTVKLMKNTDYKIELSVPWHVVNSGSVHFRYSYIHKMTSPPIVT